MVSEISIPSSTYCSNPDATHVVNVMSSKFGNGIFGYYTNEMDAYRVRRYLLENGASIASVESYDCNAPMPKIHPLVAAAMAGY